MNISGMDVYDMSQHPREEDHIMCADIYDMDVGNDVTFNQGINTNP